MVKIPLPLDCVENLCYGEIVWRQLELVFFGAATLIAALLIYVKQNTRRGYEKGGYIMKKICFAIATMILGYIVEVTFNLEMFAFLVGILSWIFALVALGDKTT